MALGVWLRKAEDQKTGEKSPHISAPPAAALVPIVSNMFLCKGSCFLPNSVLDISHCSPA